MATPHLPVLVSNDLLACVVICRAWQAEAWESWEEELRGLAMGRGSERPMETEAQAFLPHLF